MRFGNFWYTHLMETWFVYALLSALTAGLYSFFLKVSAEKNHNGSLVSTYSMFVASGLALVLFIFSLDKITPLWIFVLTAVVNGAFYLTATITRIVSLKNIHTTIYFPIYKTLGPSLMLLVSMFLFSESLNTYEWIGFLLGISVPLLLVSKSENNIQINLKKGLFYLVIGTFFAVISSSTAKVVTLNDLNIFGYIFLSFLIGGLISLAYYKRTSQQKTDSLDQLKRIGVINGVMLFLSVFFFINATIGNLAIVYTINSFSILVPIILSIFIYKEHFNLKKGVVIVLTSLSLFFFQ